jgi:hypothetical protein
MSVNLINPNVLSDALLEEMGSAPDGTYEIICTNKYVPSGRYTVLVHKENGGVYIKYITTFGKNIQAWFDKDFKEVKEEFASLSELEKAYHLEHRLKKLSVEDSWWYNCSVNFANAFPLLKKIKDTPTSFTVMGSDASDPFRYSIFGNDGLKQVDVRFNQLQYGEIETAEKKIYPSFRTFLTQLGLDPSKGMAIQAYN